MADMADSKEPQNPVKGFTTGHFTRSTFQAVLSGYNRDAVLVSWRPRPIQTGGGILANIPTSDDEPVKRVIGHRAFRLDYRLSDSDDILHKEIVMKSKARGQEVIDMLIGLQRGFGGELLETWLQFSGRLGLNHMEHRELELIKIENPALTSISPQVYWHWVDDANDIYVFAMEYLDSYQFSHMDTVDNLELWKEEDIHAVLEGAAGFHATYYGKTEKLPHSLTKWFIPQNQASMKELVPIWQALLKHNHENIHDIWSDKVYELISTGIKNTDRIYEILDACPRTLLHNDFNVRNMCLRKGNDGTRLCVYDWEVCTTGPPHHDIAEFLVFVLPQNTPTATWHQYLQQYIVYFNHKLAALHSSPPVKELNFVDFQKVFDMCVLDLLINRLATYGVSYRVYKFPYLARVIRNCVDYLQAVREGYPFLKAD